MKFILRKSTCYLIGTVIFLATVNGYPLIFMAAASHYRNAYNISDLSQWELVASGGIGLIHGMYILVQIAKGKWIRQLNEWGGFPKYL